MNLTGKTVLVTGGAKGIGKCLVERLIACDAIIGVFDIDREALGMLEKAHPQLYCRVCDVSNDSQVKAAIDAFFEKFERIDVLVNNAGIVHSSFLVKIEEGKLVRYDPEIWEKVIATNLHGVFYMTSHVVQKMLAKRTKGVVVNISSICASGNAGQSAYSVTKAGLNALTVTWAKELGPWRIRVAAVAPGFTQTNTTLHSMNEEVVKAWKKNTPLRRMAEPDEIVDGVLFILRNDFFNGRVLELDGGLRI